MNTPATNQIPSELTYKAFNTITQWVNYSGGDSAEHQGTRNRLTSIDNFLMNVPSGGFFNHDSIERIQEWLVENKEIKEFLTDLYLYTFSQFTKEDNNTFISSLANVYNNATHNDEHLEPAATFHEESNPDRISKLLRQNGFLLMLYMFYLWNCIP